MVSRRWLPWIAAGVLAALIVPSITAGSLGGLVQTSQTQHIQVTTSDELGVVAGLVTTQAKGPLGLDMGQRTPPTAGWVVLAPPGTPSLDSADVAVTDEAPFTDPNGGDWLSREIRIGATTAWAVPIGPAREDPTLDGVYNFAAIVDWSQVPADEDLSATYHETLPLTPDATR